MTSSQGADGINTQSSEAPSEENPTNLIKNPSSPWTALNDSMQEPRKMRFFGPRFMTVWVMPIAVVGIVMEFLFISPLRNANPFN